MSKKRYTLYISRPLARRFEETARQRNGAKSALVEEALADSLKPKLLPGVEDALARRLDELTRTQNSIERDVAIVTETLSLFVRYFLTVTPPLSADEQDPARLLGRQRFEAFVAEVGRQRAGDRRLVSEVLESIVANNPDLFATAGIDAPRRSPQTPAMVAAVTTIRAYGSNSSGSTNHG